MAHTTRARYVAIVSGTGQADESIVLDTLFDANTVLAADTDDTPAALTIAEQTLLGRITSGDIDALTVTELRTLFGIPQHNYAASSTPLATDDVSEGYSAGSIWVDVGSQAYICLRATENAAVWLDLA